MAKPRVTFRPKRINEDEWQIEAHYDGAEVRPHQRPERARQTWTIG